MELFNSIQIEGIYSNTFLNHFTKNYTEALSDDYCKMMRGLSVMIAAQSEHMLRCIEIQVKNYKKKTTQSSWHNSFALVNLYNGLSELQSVCSSFIMDVNNEIKTINYEGEMATQTMQPFPKTLGYPCYLAFKGKEVLKSKIWKGNTVVGERITLDSNELTRLLRKRRGGEYPENYSELTKKCQDAYIKLWDKLKLLQKTRVE
jgi:hypothetical protein